MTLAKPPLCGLICSSLFASNTKFSRCPIQDLLNYACDQNRNLLLPILRPQLLSPPLLEIGLANDAYRPALEHVGIDHGGIETGVLQELLNDSDILPTL